MGSATGYQVTVAKLDGPGGATYAYGLSCEDRPGWSERAGYPFKSYDSALRAGLHALQQIITENDLRPYWASDGHPFPMQTRRIIATSLFGAIPRALNPHRWWRKGNEPRAARR